ncbi:MAG: transposase [Candidatus Sericytochromatia bacterium]|nr:transposase [Candidatus Sericytochromatia bacterium]
MAALHAQIRPFFHRSESFQNAVAYLDALSFSPCQHNCWTLAETAGYEDPQPFQRLLRTAKWDHQALRQWHERTLYTQLDHPEACWSVDDTGFLKKGKASAGVQRQYSGTAGRTENCQIAVALAYSFPKGYALTDCRLYPAFLTNRSVDKNWLLSVAILRTELMRQWPRKHVTLGRQGGI